MLRTWWRRLASRQLLESRVYPSRRQRHCPLRLELLEDRVMLFHCHIALFDAANPARSEPFEPPWTAGAPTQAQVPDYPINIPQAVSEVAPGSPAASVTYFVTAYSCGGEAGCPANYSVDLHIIQGTAHRGVRYQLPDLSALPISPNFLQSTTAWTETAPGSGDFFTTLTFNSSPTGTVFGDFTSLTITIPIISDTTFQLPQTFKVQLENAQNTVLGNDTAGDGGDHFRDPSEGTVTVSDFLPRPDPQINTVNGVAVTTLGAQTSPTPTINVPEGSSPVDLPISVTDFDSHASGLSYSFTNGPSGVAPPGATVSGNGTLTPKFTFTPSAATGSSAAPNPFSVTFTANDHFPGDPDGTVDSNQSRDFFINVTNVAPNVAINVPLVVHPNVSFNSSFTFHDAGSGDGPWTALVDFGDGTQFFITSTPQAPPPGATNIVDANMAINDSTILLPGHTFGANSTITVTVTDSVGASSLSGVASQLVQVADTIDLDNVGFEAPSLAPWAVATGGVGSEVASLGGVVLPPVGGQTQFGLLQTGGATSATAMVTGPDARSGTNGTILLQTADLSAGQQISMAFNFLTNEAVGLLGYPFTDFARGDVLDADGNVVGTLFNVNTQSGGFSSAAGSGFANQTGWLTSSTVTITTDGFYTLRFIVSNVGDQFADSALGLDNISLSNVAPKNINITQTSGALVEGGTFTGSVQFRDTGVNNTQSWSALINYGDGSTATVSGITSRTFTIPSHVYAETNLTGYNLQVTVTDNGGLSGIGSLLVPVADAPPTLTVTPSATTVFEHQLLNVVGNFTDPGFDTATTTESYSFSINWGDLTPLSTGPATITTPGSPGVPTAGTFSASHAFSHDGTFVVSVTLSDDDGGSVTQFFSVTVKNVDIIATGNDAGGQPRVHVFDSETHHEKFNFLAFESSFGGGVRVAVGDVNGDGFPDIIVARGPGSTPEVRVFDGQTHTQLPGPIGDFQAYSGFGGGVYVAAGDVNNDGHADIITGRGEGGDTRVKVFNGATGATMFSFLAYGSSYTTTGVRVAAGDINNDGHADIITGLGPGGVPRVKAFDGNSAVPLGTAPTTLRSFLAYLPDFTGGVYVAAGDTTGDGLADIITGKGNGAPRVKIFTGAPVAPGVTPLTLHSFDAFQPSHSGLNANSLVWTSGVRVAAVDVTGDGLVDVVTAPGPGQFPEIHTFDPTQTVTKTSNKDLLDILFSDPSAVVFKPAFGFMVDPSTFMRGLSVG